jgi:branched-chain amino acid transport system substrate-binding protein
MNSNQLRIACVVIASMAGGVALAEDGVTEKTIVFGQVAALTGPAQDLGQGMRQGILAAFEDANRGGGISGRTLALKSRDDGYEPEKTVEATKASLDEDKIFALIGAVGTPTSKASQPIATAAARSPAPNFCAIRTTATSSTCAAPISRRPKPGSST